MPKTVSGPSTKTSKSKLSQKGAPKLYSNFLPLPILIPTPIPIPSSSSSRPINETKHYLYCRAHKPKASTGASASASKAKETEEGLPEGRTVFVVNLPVDVTDRELRTVFGKYGVVEDVRIGKRETGDVLEGVVRGMEVEQSDESEDDEDEDEDEDADEDEEIGDEDDDDRPEATFKGDLLTKKQRRALRRRNLPTSIPEIDPLPTLCPRSTPYLQSGLSSAHIIFLDPISVSRLLSSTPEPVSLPKYGKGEPTGLAYYTALYKSLRPSVSAIKSFADTSMARFDHLHSLLLSSRAKEQGAGALVDEDGFTVVVRSGKYGRAGARGDGFGKGGVGVATRGFEKKKGKGGKGSQALPDFYKFQALDRKRQDLAELRQKFEHDKARVEELKKSRRYKPY
ncbi:ribosomal RNA-processing protein 7 [Cryptococcus neoformans 125.91]|nr:ribosomal RNA-processing protein 7 [Cryptococcus neoformans var. grubii 125.91]